MVYNMDILKDIRMENRKLPASLIPRGTSAIPEKTLLKESIIQAKQWKNTTDWHPDGVSFLSICVKNALLD